MLTQLAGRAGRPEGRSRSSAIGTCWPRSKGPTSPRSRPGRCHELHRVEGVIAHAARPPSSPPTAWVSAGCGDPQRAGHHRGRLLRPHAGAGRRRGRARRAPVGDRGRGGGRRPGRPLRPVGLRSPQPWEVASGVVLEEFHGAPRRRVEPSTLVSIAYEEPDEDRDQFSAWTVARLSSARNPAVGIDRTPGGQREPHALLGERDLLHRRRSPVAPRATRASDRRATRAPTRPDVSPTTSAPASHAGSTVGLVVDQVCRRAELARRPRPAGWSSMSSPTRSPARRPTRGASSFTASWRFCVA